MCLQFRNGPSNFLKSSSILCMCLFFKNLAILPKSWQLESDPAAEPRVQRNVISLKFFLHLLLSGNIDDVMDPPSNEKVIGSMSHPLFLFKKVYCRNYRKRLNIKMCLYIWIFFFKDSAFPFLLTQVLFIQFRFNNRSQYLVFTEKISFLLPTYAAQEALQSCTPR